MTLTITHTHADGAMIEGNKRGDGTDEILKANRWRWSRYLGSWFLPHSCDNTPIMHVINSTAEELRKAEFDVELDLDTSIRTAAEVEADKAERAEACVKALEAKAERKAKEAQAAHQASQAALSRLP